MRQLRVSSNLLNDKEAAAWLGMSPSTLRSWRCRGIGPAYIKFGSGKKAAVRYDQQDLEQYIAQGRHVSDASVRAARED
jgi:predicted DNA-binding transcriptional regulator AlpA